MIMPWISNGPRNREDNFWDSVLNGMSLSESHTLSGSLEQECGGDLPGPSVLFSRSEKSGPGLLPHPFTVTELRRPLSPPPGRRTEVAFVSSWSWAESAFFLCLRPPPTAILGFWIR